MVPATEGCTQDINIDENLKIAQVQRTICHIIFLLMVLKMPQIWWCEIFQWSILSPFPISFWVILVHISSLNQPPNETWYVKPISLPKLVKSWSHFSELWGLANQLSANLGEDATNWGRWFRRRRFWPWAPGEFTNDTSRFRWKDQI